MKPISTDIIQIADEITPMLKGVYAKSGAPTMDELQEDIIHAVDLFEHYTCGEQLAELIREMQCRITMRMDLGESVL